MLRKHLRIQVGSRPQLPVLHLKDVTRFGVDDAIVTSRISFGPRAIVARFTIRDFDETSSSLTGDSVNEVASFIARALCPALMKY